MVNRKRYSIIHKFNSVNYRFIESRFTSLATSTALTMHLNVTVLNIHLQSITQT